MSYSPDGRFWWDGQQWVPVQGAPNLPTPYVGQPTGMMPVHAKSPVGHVAASFFIPGLGSMLAGESGKGIAILLAWLISIPLAFLFIGIFTGLGAWVFGMVDAYSSARNWNLRHGILS